MGPVVIDLPLFFLNGVIRNSFSSMLFLTKRRDHTTCFFCYIRTSTFPHWLFLFRQFSSSTFCLRVRVQVEARREGP